MFKLGLKKPIDSQDIYKNLTEHGAARITDRFSEHWEAEKCRKRPRIFNVIRKVFLNKVIGLSILFSAVDIVSR